MVIAGIMLMCAFSCAQTPEPEGFHVTIELGLSSYEGNIQGILQCKIRLRVDGFLV